MDKTYPIETAEPIEAELRLPAGRLELRRAEGDVVAVSLQPLHLGGRRSAEAIERTEVSFDGRRLAVHVPTRFRTPELRLTVALPAGSWVLAKTASADVDCDVDLGQLEAKSASGDITGCAVEGDVVAATASGDLRLARVGGRLEARGASGDVTVEAVAGDVVVTTASGDVTIGEAGRSAKIRSSSGDVALGSASGGEINVSTASGDITIGVAAGQGAWLDLTTVSGDASCSLPDEAAAASTAELSLRCNTVSGDILVRSADAA